MFEFVNGVMYLGGIQHSTKVIIAPSQGVLLAHQNILSFSFFAPTKSVIRVSPGIDLGKVQDTCKGGEGDTSITQVKILALMGLVSIIPPFMF